MTPPDFLAWLRVSPRRTLVMGVLNVTPDSFSDGGQFAADDRAVAHGRQMIADGVDLIDVGGESTRPGAARVPSDVQIVRVVPVIRELARFGIAISIDTTRAAVAAAALDAGAALVNDVSAGNDDLAMASLVSGRGVPIVLMHMRGQPGTMQQNPTYADVVAEVSDYLSERAAAFAAAGVARSNILLDPGIGFGKTVDHNLSLLRHLNSLTATPYPILVGVSRKGYIGTLLNRPDPADRDFGTAASVAWAVAQGVAVVRVHDVRAMKDVVTLTESIAKAR